MNQAFKDIVTVFEQAGIPKMDRLPEDMESRAKFATLFRQFMTYLQAAEIQGFTWEKQDYPVMGDVHVTQAEEAAENAGDHNGAEGTDGAGNDAEDRETVHVIPTKGQLQVLLLRYKELRKKPEDPDPKDGPADVPYEIDSYLTEMNTGAIDNDYMNSRFEKWKKELSQPGIDPARAAWIMEDLHKSFAFLSQDDQKYANLFLHDVQTGDIRLSDQMTFRDYISLYKNNAKRQQVRRLTKYLGCLEKLVYQMLDAHVTKDNINAFGRLDALEKTVDKDKAKAYFTALDGKPVPPFVVNNRVDQLLREFILAGGMDIPEPGEKGQ